MQPLTVIKFLEEMLCLLRYFILREHLTDRQILDMQGIVQIFIVLKFSKL